MSGYRAGPLVGYELPAGTEPVATARAAEAAGVDFLVLPDRPAAPDDRPGPPAALITASWLATRTERIGLVIEMPPAYTEPYNLARMLASLDHVSGGRSGWLASSAPDPAADANHRRAGVDPAVDRAARTAEYLPLLRDLWDTWEDGAFTHDKATMQFVDGDRVHTLNHEGPLLRVAGPLNVIRPPQGHPLVLADADDRGAAADADVLIGRSPGDDDRPWLWAARPDDVRRSGPDDADGAVGWLVRFDSAEECVAFTEAGLPTWTADRPAERPFLLRERFGLSRPANRLAHCVGARTGRTR
ncbi:Flavin-dependent oxidoreductase, luciferase family (includes alkanesulfonate monooxygenase SsuD and methylene tetrahydromethanopterin reductase) [Micromonospora nigra]|uniref:Flavin-dependent oxidoreductase, luciferase family (Includes alkanesulfonate monooxygenase SsuD and methylene tetrahydromethanopterin reductase) n=1 Tax=Micromonospora nigra TaxID=145857 RepID=A0A1C6RCV2_9ACTN|nr:LLM class flavin-dependent oxidoreductase [Micromonospora nigra]SCL14868.1 Flavin-dependent oxidoreductase, luciferase family (includes alkanesulfonate monooxygenase SsuD and methylene tetrahydromethanopterin reductase) [Micromonospora nigra]